jgi:hypothetical protein
MITGARPVRLLSFSAVILCLFSFNHDSGFIIYHFQQKRNAFEKWEKICHPEQSERSFPKRSGDKDPSLTLRMTALRQYRTMRQEQIPRKFGF